jgi:hypothetical protein
LLAMGRKDTAVSKIFRQQAGSYNFE